MSFIALHHHVTMFLSKPRKFRLKFGKENQNSKHQNFFCFWSSHPAVHWKPILYHALYNTLNPMLCYSDHNCIQGFLSHRQIWNDNALWDPGLILPLSALSQCLLCRLTWVVMWMRHHYDLERFVLPHWRVVGQRESLLPHPAVRVVKRHHVKRIQHLQKWKRVLYY